jgi:hypothetical protein
MGASQNSYTLHTLLVELAATLPPVSPGLHALETLSTEIHRIVAERQELRSSGASHDVLEENRRVLADAHTRFSRALIQRYLPQSAAA